MLKYFRLYLLILFFMVLSATVQAGPPFVTDDPEPVEPHHWEFLLGSQNIHTADGWTGTMPHGEVNYGAIDNVQLHIIVPLAYSKSDQGPSESGLGDTEVGSKIRLIQETNHRPQIGIYPLVEIPTGDEGNNLGTGHTQAYLPVWLQKSWGPWKTYGGGGYWINPGTGNKNWTFLGWELQKDLSKQLMLGAEIFHRTANTVDLSNAVGFNVGGQFNIDDGHHILLSAGRDTSGPNHFTGYLAFLRTVP